MKKYLFIAFAAAAMTSCSQDEVMEMNKEAISFGGAFVENSTRAATDNTYGPKKAIPSFTLYGTVEGVNIYNNVTVTNPKANDENQEAGYNQVWECPVTQYWVAGADYEFAAVVGATTINVNQTTKMPTSLEYTAADQTDMLYQKVTTVGQPTTNEGLVAFTFSHLLAKAKFTVTNITDHTKVQEGTAYTYDITDLQITNAYEKATYDVTNSWQITESTPVKPTNFGSISNLIAGDTNKQECATEMLLIPGLTNVQVSFNYIIKINGTEIYKTTTPVTKEATVAGGITANCAYNFNLSVGLNTPIEFTVTKAPEWVTPVKDVTVPEQKQ